MELFVGRGGYICAYPFTATELRALTDELVLEWDEILEEDRGQEVGGA